MCIVAVMLTYCVCCRDLLLGPHADGTMSHPFDHAGHDMRAMYVAKMAYDPSKMGYDPTKMGYDPSLASMTNPRTNMMKPDMLAQHLKPHDAASLLHHFPNMAAAAAASYPYHSYDTTTTATLQAVAAVPHQDM